MARPKAAQITLSGAYKTGGAPPRGAADDDHRLKPPGAAENVLGAYFRSGVIVDPATEAAPSWQRNGTTVAMAATTLPEYVVPDLVYSAPGSSLLLAFNRVFLLPFRAAIDGDGLDIDPVDTVPPGAYWLYRAVLEDGTVQQRVRIGTPPVPEADTVVMAVQYLVDFTAR
jgi:hypothetical protein